MGIRRRSGYEAIKVGRDKAGEVSGDSIGYILTLAGMGIKFLPTCILPTKRVVISKLRIEKNRGAFLII